MCARSRQLQVAQRARERAHHRLRLYVSAAVAEAERTTPSVAAGFEKMFCAELAGPRTACGSAGPQCAQERTGILTPLEHFHQCRSDDHAVDVAG